jgi:hypothetical protein
VVRFDLVRSRQPHLSCRVGASSGFIVGSERRGGRVSSVNFPPAALVNCDAQLFGGLDRRVWVELGAGRRGRARGAFILSSFCHIRQSRQALKVAFQAAIASSIAAQHIHLGGAAHARQLDPDEWAILRRVIDLIQANAKGAELGPVLETIKNALRADQAKMIEAR